MTGESKPVYKKFIHMYGKYTGCLGCVQNKEKVMFPAEAAKKFYRHNRAAYIGGMETDKSLGMRCYERRKSFCFHASVGVSGNAGKGNAFFGKLDKGTHDCIVFHRRDEHMISLMEKSFQKNIQACCNIGSKNYIFCFGKMKQAAELLSCFINLFFDRKSRLVSSAIYIYTGIF